MWNKYNKQINKYLLFQKSNGSDQKEVQLDLMADWNPIIKKNKNNNKISNLIIHQQQTSITQFIISYEEKSLRNEYNKTNE